MTSLLLAASLSAQSALPAAGDLPSRVGPPPVPPVCSVTLVVTVSERGDPTEEQTYRYDAQSEEWRYLAYNGAPPPAEEREQFEERGRDGGDRSDDPIPPGGYYADSVEKLSADWTLQSSMGPDGPALWSLEDLPKGTVVANGRDLSGNIRLRYLVEDGRVTVAGGQLKKRWRIPLIARIDAFAIQRRFAEASAETGVPGAMLPVSEHVEISADVLGKDRSAVLDTDFQAWDCVPGGAASTRTADAW